MIELYTGTPGSGKSLHSAEVILNWLKKKPCLLNFELNLKQKDFLKLEKNYHFLSDQEMNPENLIAFAKKYWFEKGTKIKEDYILLIIDEAQLLFNCRDWGNKSRSAWLSFFTQHRKLGYHIILVAQFDSMIDKQIRSLVEYEYIHRKINNYGLIGKILSIIVLGNLFCVVKNWYPMRQKISASFFTGHKKFYKIYDTYNTFSQA